MHNLKVRKKSLYPGKFPDPHPNPPPLKKCSVPNLQTSVFDLFSSSSVSRSLDDVSFGVNGDDTFSVLSFWFGSPDSSSVEPPYVSSSSSVFLGPSDTKNKKNRISTEPGRSFRQINLRPYQARYHSSFAGETSLKYWEVIRKVTWDCGKTLLAFHWYNATNNFWDYKARPWRQWWL